MPNKLHELEISTFCFYFENFPLSLFSNDDQGPFLLFNCGVNTALFWVLKSAIYSNSKCLPVNYLCFCCADDEEAPKFFVFNLLLSTLNRNSLVIHSSCSLQQILQLIR